MANENTLPVITDEMCRAAILAGKTDRIQGFSYGPDFTAPHVVRDVARHPEEQVLWSGASHDEMMDRHAIERMRLQLAAALAAQQAEALTFRIVPYTDEEERPDPAMAGLVMLSIGRDGEIPVEVLDRIPEAAAKVICKLASASGRKGG
ncbi:hypothetical protein ABMY26_23645 [Azospirillum sp. HJ39]|uniref:hypothetical protein n=1 Tax=Azospirillum sp. HJ39 TaxID=3159496 RepID=UPI003558E56D